MIPSREETSRLVGLSVLAVAAVLCALPWLLRDGFPVNHDSLATFQRIEGFRRALANGDWYPLWTPYAWHGYGSPYPLFYHRLFSTLGAWLSPRAGAVLPAVKALIVLLLFLGGAGMRRLLRVAGTSEPFAVIGGLLFMVAPYTVLDWLVRGSMAEFTALMILPWIYADLCLFLQGKRRWISLAIGIVLEFHAHSMICYFFLVSGLVFVVVSLRPRWRRIAWRGVRSEWPFISIAALLAGLAIVPQTIIALRLMPYFLVSDMTQLFNLKIEDNFHPISEYLANPAKWTEPLALSFEINRYLCVAFLVFALIPGRKRRWQAVLGNPFFVGMLVWTALCLLLQFRRFELVYELLPEGRYLDFPWRLLTFLTIGSIVLTVLLAQEAWRQSQQRDLVAAVLGVTVIASAVHFGLMPLRNREAIPPQRISDALTDLDGPNSAGEYVLKASREESGLTRRRPFIVADCRQELSGAHVFNGKEMLLTGHVTAPCLVSLRQFQTPMLTIGLQNAVLRSRSPSSVINVELEPGESSLRLRPSTFRELFIWALRTKG